MFLKIAWHGFMKQFSIVMACQEDVEVTNIEHMYLMCDENHTLVDFSFGVFYCITLHSAIFSICWIRYISQSCAVVVFISGCPSLFSFVSFKVSYLQPRVTTKGKLTLATNVGAFWCEARTMICDIEGTLEMTEWGIAFAKHARSKIDRKAQNEL